MGIVIPLVVAGLALLALGASKSEAKRQEAAVDPGPEAAPADRIASAIASRSPARHRKLAKELAKTNPKAAAALEKEADKLEAKPAARRGPARHAPEDPRRVAAEALNGYLRALGLRGKYSEDRSRILAWQRDEGLTPDGFYGPGSATKLLTTYGLVAAAPLYWSKKNAPAQLAAFSRLVTAARSGDRRRGGEYDQLMADTLRSYRGESGTGPGGAASRPVGKAGYLDMMGQAATLRRSGWNKAADEMARQADLAYPAGKG